MGPVAGVWRARATRARAGSRDGRLGRASQPQHRGRGSGSGVRRLRRLRVHRDVRQRYVLPHARVAGRAPLAGRGGHHDLLHVRGYGQRDRRGRGRARIRRRRARNLLYRPRAGRSGHRPAHRSDPARPPRLLDGRHGPPAGDLCTPWTPAGRRLCPRARRALARPRRGCDRRLRLVLDAVEQAPDRRGRGRGHHERLDLRAASAVACRLRPQGGWLRRVSGADVGPETCA